MRQRRDGAPGASLWSAGAAGRGAASIVSWRGITPPAHATVNGPTLPEGAIAPAGVRGYQPQCGIRRGMTLRRSRKEHCMATEPEPPAGNVWRFDVVAGLTAAAVVIPKAMAYAAVAGLPVAVGLYTAFIPMVVYAVLGTSRVLSVSSTTTLAILAGTAARHRRARRRPGQADHRHRHADRAGRGDAAARPGGPPRLRRRLHFRAGAHRIQGRHRPRDRARPDPQAARHPHHQARLLPRPAERRPARSRDLAADARRGRGDARRPGGDGSALAALAGAAGGGGPRDRRVVVLRPRRRSASRPSARFPRACRRSRCPTSRSSSSSRRRRRAWR